MKRLFVAIALGACALVPVACNKSPEGGVPGTDNKFELKGGTLPAAIKPGDAESVKISVDRGKNFHQSVRLEAKAPDSVAATLDRKLVKDGESSDVNVQLRPKENAAPGDYKVQVTATPDSGSPTTLELTVKVIAK
jgi:uncharacterized membrane protein